MTKRKLRPWLGGLTALVLLGLGIAFYSNQVLQVRALDTLGIANWHVPSVKIAENTYYVGGYDAASFLITGKDGHILIDGGYADTAPLILANISELGFDPRDVKIILNTHGHFDHAAGIAALKRATGAKLFASPEEARLIEAGGRGDFHFGDQFAYEPAKADKLLIDGEMLTLGGPVLTAQFTPGHTKGCTSWSWSAIVEGKPRSVLLICSLSQLGAPISNNRLYPKIGTDWEATFARIKQLGCDIFLTPHGTQFGAQAKSRRVSEGDAEAFIDPEGCKDHVRQQRSAFERARK